MMKPALSTPNLLYIHNISLIYMHTHIISLSHTNMNITNITPAQGKANQGTHPVMTPKQAVEGENSAG